MENTIFKAKTLTLTILLTISLCTILLSFPIVTSQTVDKEKTTHAYIGATPNPIGVGQQVLLHVGITDYKLHYHHGWEGLTITMTKPDGTIETMGPFRTDSTGGTGTPFTPTMVGIYKFQTHFPEQVYTWEYPPIFDPDVSGTILYKASDSDILELVVTQEQREYFPGHELPSEYWTRPIDAQLREWSEVSGNWVREPDNLYAPYNDGPETAHILWAHDLERGGLAGGMFGPHAYQCGDAYEGKFDDSIIIAGVLYYNRFTEAGRGGPPAQGVAAVDLRTGEELWFRNNTRVSFGQVFYWDSFNYHATFGYVWEAVGSTWNAYDLQTGEWIYSLENVPRTGETFGASYTVVGDKGEIYIYGVDLDRGYMSLWNSSRAVQPQNTGAGSNDGSWGRQIPRKDSDRIIDAMDTGIEWNVSIPTGLPGGVTWILDDRIIGTTVQGWTGLGNNPIEMWAIGITPNNRGDLLWQKSWQPPPGELSIDDSSASSEENLFVLWAKEPRQLFGFDTQTGNLKWGPTESQHYLGIFDTYEVIVYGKIVSARMSGIVYCYDADTGDLEWTYDAHDEYTEVLWSDNWPVRPLFVADGKVYLGHSEHSPVDPKSRGAPFICLEVETGDEVWRIDGAFRVTDWGGRPIIGDSIIAAMDTFDQRIYAIGKGPSKITINSVDTGVNVGSSVMIRGKITDVSPGTQDYALTSRFPNGVPVVADESMSEWMLYVYKQFERPDNCVGVPVKIEIIDPDGNYAWAGTPTTDMDGNYIFPFVPQKQGQYMIIATFEGSEAYYGSHAISYLIADPAVTPSTPITPQEPTSFITTEVAIIAGISVAVILGLVSFAFLRKRK